MSRPLKEARIGGRAERKRLETGIYWRGIDPEVHLGYRKTRRGGSWLVRWRSGAGYRQKPIGTADDELSEGTLDFNAATRLARETVETERKIAVAIAAGPLLTVRHAVEIYSQIRDARDSSRQGRSVRSDATGRLERYITGKPTRGRRKAVACAPLAEVTLHDLHEGELLAWRAALPAELKGATKQRLVNDLKAALNEAYATHRKRLPVTLPAIIKHGLRAIDVGGDEAADVARENQILTDGQVAKLIGAARAVDVEQGWEGDLFRMIVVLAATGARFSQVARLRVMDLQTVSRRMIVPASRKGRGKKATGTPMAIGQDVIEALLPAVTGRPNDATLLERWRSRQVAGSIRWERVARGPWQTPSELNRAWAAIRQRAEMPEVIPYAFRHSSIVRGIRANLPIRLVAALHDTSVVMIERHYGRFVADGLDELAARSVVPLVPQTVDDNVVQLSRS